MSARRTEWAVEWFWRDSTGELFQMREELRNEASARTLLKETENDSRCSHGRLLYRTVSDWQLLPASGLLGKERTE